MAGDRTWLLTRRRLRIACLVLVLALVTSGTVSTATYEPPSTRAGVIASPAEGTTIITTQGVSIEGYQPDGKPGRLLAVGPEGKVQWIYEGSEFGIVTFYDVDPLSNGNLLVVGVKPGTTFVIEFDPTTREPRWVERFALSDTHDVDLINGDELLIADKDDDRILVYDRTSEEFTWRWSFADHYDRSVGGLPGDWTHVNDVDRVGPGRYLVSPRNFDQAIVVNRSTGNVTARLGTDDDHDVLHEQHNPQYLTATDGTPSVLVADSENDRVVEYERAGSEWVRTWQLGSSRSLSWPRDADRLPNGNTLVVDTLNNRVIEVTPEGRVVWEIHVTFAPYDVERIQYGDEPAGPTITDRNASGTYPLSHTGGARGAPREWGADSFGTPIVSIPDYGPIRRSMAEYDRIAPWVRPTWLSPWGFVSVLAAGALSLAYGCGELVRRVSEADRGG